MYSPTPTFSLDPYHQARLDLWRSASIELSIGPESADPLVQASIEAVLTWLRGDGSTPKVLLDLYGQPHGPLGPQLHLVGSLRIVAEWASENLSQSSLGGHNQPLPEPPAEDVYLRTDFLIFCELEVQGTKKLLRSIEIIGIERHIYRRETIAQSAGLLDASAFGGLCLLLNESAPFGHHACEVRPAG